MGWIPPQGRLFVFLPGASPASWLPRSPVLKQSGALRRTGNKWAGSPVSSLFNLSDGSASAVSIA